VSVPPDQIRAVVVGVESYAAGKGWNLDGPAQDAIRFAEWLRGKDVPAAHIRLLMSPLDPATRPDAALGLTVEPATQERIHHALREELAPPTPRALYVFWGGHGLIKRDEQRRLVLADATEKDIRSLNLADLMQYLRSDAVGGASAGSLAQQVFIVDACAEFAERKGLRGIDQLLTENTFPKGSPMDQREQFVLLATRPAELAKNLTAEKTGLFSREFLKILAREPSAWPDWRRLTCELQAVFDQLRAQGQARQSPAYLWVRDWNQAQEYQVGRLPGEGVVPQTESTAAFFDRVDPSMGISRVELGELCSLASPCQPEVPASASRQAHRLVTAGAVAGMPPVDVENQALFQWCIYDLGARFPAALFKFLALCRPHFLGPPVAAAIAAWETRVATRLRLDLDLIKADLAKLLAHDSPSSEQVLQVIVEPVHGFLAEQDPYQLHLCVRDQQSGTAKPLCSSESLLTGGEGLTRAFPALFARALTAGLSVQKLGIEALLPRELLAQGINHWPILDGKWSRAIGIKFPTWLRSYERAYAQELAARDPQSDYRPAAGLHRSKWEKLAGGLSVANVSQIPDCQQLSDDILLEWEGADILAMATLTQPLPQPEANEASAVDYLILAGLPLAFWLSGTSPVAQTPGTIATLAAQFLAHPPAEWPALAREIRRQSLPLRPAACSDFSLFWDNPETGQPPLASRLSPPLTSP